MKGPKKPKRRSTADSLEKAAYDLDVAVFGKKEAEKKKKRRSKKVLCYT